MRGASTLSQQTAKNLFMWSDRSFLRKGLEAWFTLLMELGWDKARILEVYLNIVEFGPGIYGAEAAARTYFGKPASRLTRYESSPAGRRPAQIRGVIGSSPRHPMCRSARSGSAARWGNWVRSPSIGCIRPTDPQGSSGFSGGPR